MIKMLSQKQNTKVKVQLASKSFTYNCVGEAAYYGNSCKYPIVSIPLDVASRYLQNQKNGLAHYSSGMSIMTLSLQEIYRQSGVSKLIR